MPPPTIAISIARLLWVTLLSSRNDRNNDKRFWIPVPPSIPVEKTRDRMMASLEKRTFRLPAEQASYIDKLVAAGAYASGSEVVRAGLAALREREAEVEQWLCEEVVPVYDAMEADPARGVSADEVAKAIDAHHAKHLKTKSRGA